MPAFAFAQSGRGPAEQTPCSEVCLRVMKGSVAVKKPHAAAWLYLPHQAHQCWRRLAQLPFVSEVYLESCMVAALGGRSAVALLHLFWL